MPSNRKVKREILSFLIKNEIVGPTLSKIKKPCHIFELGSGWGGLLFTVASKSPAALFLACELSPLPWLFSIMVQKMGRYSNVKILRKNFFSIPLEGADVVLCYLYPGAMLKLKAKFERELKVGSWVISNSFSIPGWTPENVIEVAGLWRTEIFIYRR